MSPARLRNRPVRPARRALLGSAAAVLTVLAATVPVAGAQEQPADPAREVLAVVSPIANPVCGAAGAATLLVPVVGGLVEDQVDLGDVKLADVILDAIGPVYVTCGTLPAPDGTRCEIDNEVVALWPLELSDAGLIAPALVGNLVEALGRAGSLLGIPLDEVVQPALRCAIPDEAGTPEPPPPPLPPPSPPPGDADDAGTAPPVDAGPGLPTGGAGGSGGAAFAPVPSGMPLLDEVAAPQPAVPAGGEPLTVLEIVARQVSGSTRALQALVGLLLAAFLAASWFRSWSETRRAVGSAG